MDPVLADCIAARWIRIEHCGRNFHVLADFLSTLRNGGDNSSDLLGPPDTVFIAADTAKAIVRPVGDFLARGGFETFSAAITKAVFVVGI